MSCQALLPCLHVRPWSGLYGAGRLSLVIRSFFHRGQDFAQSDGSELVPAWIGAVLSCVLTKI